MIFPSYRDGRYIYSVARDYRRGLYTISRSLLCFHGPGEDVPNSPVATMEREAGRMMIEYARRCGLVQINKCPGDVAASRRAQERIAI